jgi:thioredoxin reductase (NADPH)
MTVRRAAGGRVRVVGRRYAPGAHEIREFLAHNGVGYRWVEAPRGGPGETTVVLPDGEVLHRPSVHELAERLGLIGHPTRAYYDLAVVGAGPAGLCAAVYGASEGLRTVLIEREAPGGQAGTTSRIENYLGFPDGLSGEQLARRATHQAERFGVEILDVQEAVGLRRHGRDRVIGMAGGDELGCRAVVIATGVAWRRLDVPGVERLLNAGVYYGASLTEARSCRDDEVVLIGGANSAGQAAVHFARHARRVTLLCRGPSLEARMSRYLIDQIADQPNVHVRTGTAVASVQGGSRLESVTVAGGGQSETLRASALFILIGAEPRTEWLAGLLARDDHGFLLTGPDVAAAPERAPVPWPLDRDPLLAETSVPGVFAAGDVRSSSVKRVAAAVGQGALAVGAVHQYLALGA